MVSSFYQLGQLPTIIVAENRVSGRSNSWARRRSGLCCLGLLTKPSQFLTCFLQQLARRGCFGVSHHCQEDAASGLGIGLCVNQTRAVMEAVFGRETEFVRTPKHGIRGKLENWSGKKYRAAKSLTPFFELLMAGYFVVAVHIAVANGHYISVPFLLLFLFGFAYVGATSAWQGGFGQVVRGLWQRDEQPAVTVISPRIPAAASATPAPILLPVETERTDQVAL